MVDGSVGTTDIQHPPSSSNLYCTRYQTSYERNKL